MWSQHPGGAQGPRVQRVKLARALVGHMISKVLQLEPDEKGTLNMEHAGLVGGRTSGSKCGVDKAEPGELPVYTQAFKYCSRVLIVRKLMALF